MYNFLCSFSFSRAKEKNFLSFYLSLKCHALYTKNVPAAVVAEEEAKTLLLLFPPARPTKLAFFLFLQSSSFPVYLFILFYGEKNFAETETHTPTQPEFLYTRFSFFLLKNATFPHCRPLCHPSTVRKVPFPSNPSLPTSYTTSCFLLSVSLMQQLVLQTNCQAACPNDCFVF